LFDHAPILDQIGGRDVEVTFDPDNHPCFFRAAASSRRPGHAVLDFESPSFAIVLHNAREVFDATMFSGA